MTDVSVVLPTHNRSEWLRLALISVLRQREVGLEIIVVDDGSSDDTVQVVKDLDDRRIRLLRHERPRGVSEARNHGSAEARAEWLAFIDDDDLWAPEKLVRQLEAAGASARDWAYTGVVNIDEGLRILAPVRPAPPDEIVGLLLRRNAIPGGGSNVVVRRDVFNRVGPFDTALKNTEDWEMWIRLAKQGLPAWVPEPLLAYRVHPGNASLDIEAIFAGVTMIERRHGTRTDRGVLHRWIAESCLRTGQRSMAVKHLALAASRGQAREVLDDVAAILRRRIRRQFGLRRASEDGPQRDEWMTRAREWLGALTGAVEAT
jgi:glycosyltransferase involved in cell wall biosynthesis